METQLLRDKDIFPSSEVLENALGKNVYTIFNSFIEEITTDEYGLNSEWRFYNDGKSWLCKVVYKKKTILWLSIWEGYFKVSFFFTEKHREGIIALNISETIKHDFILKESSGHLIPMIININCNEQIPDIITIIHFKKI